jgi:hypothetical protein
MEHVQSPSLQESEEELEPNVSSKRRLQLPSLPPSRVIPYTTSSNIGAYLPSPPRSPPPGRPRAHPEVTYANFENDANWNEDKQDVCLCICVCKQCTYTHRTCARVHTPLMRTCSHTAHAHMFTHCSCAHVHTPLMRACSHTIPHTL